MIKVLGTAWNHGVFFMVTPKDFIPAMPEDSIQELKLATKFTGALQVGRKFGIYKMK